MNEYNSQNIFCFCRKATSLSPCRSSVCFSALLQSKIVCSYLTLQGGQTQVGMGGVGCLRVPGTDKESAKEAEQGHQDWFLSTQESAWPSCIWQWFCLVGARSPWSPLSRLPHPNTFLSEVNAARCQGVLSPQGGPWARCWCSKGEMELREVLLNKRICIGPEGFSV